MKKVLVVAVTAGMLLVSATGATAAVLSKTQITAGNSAGSTYGYGKGDLAVTAIVDRVVPGAPGFGAVVLPAIVPPPDTQGPADLFAPPADFTLASLGVPPTGEPGATASIGGGAGGALANIGADALGVASIASNAELRGGQPGFAVPEPNAPMLAALALLGLTWAATRRAKPALRRRA